MPVAQEVFVKIPRLQFYNTMLDCYVNSLAMEAALGLFTRIHCKDAASWNTTISGLAVVAWNAMMYGDADCGELDRAVKVFENVLVKSVVAYIVDTDNRGK
ncbi:unnamed protein product [Linum tenue]|uniref:Uncharacterized protein n=1 Tax=Linum tenue TaxID=586396 RepID=A0AAV0Q2Z3_9ROSI|nr:unnamed protein product [Linum tenue]